MDIEAIENILKEKQLTKVELAARLGMSKQNLNALLKSDNPTLQKVLALADALGVSVSYLLGDKVGESPAASPDMCAFVRCDGVHRTADNWAEFWSLVDELGTLHPRQ